MPHTTVIVPPSALPARPLAARLVLAASYASMGAALWVLWLPRWLPPATLPLGLPPTPRDASFGWLVRLAAVAALGYCPGARLVVVPDAGHISNLENPAEFNRALADFLDRL